MYIGCLSDQLNWSGPFNIVVMTPDLESSDLDSNPGRGTRLEVFYRFTSPPTTFDVVARMTSIRNDGQPCAYGV